jgi:hypothetical protein
MTSFGGVYAQIDFPMLVAEWVRILSVAGVALVLANIKITTAKNGSKEIAPPNGP